MLSKRGSSRLLASFLGVVLVGLIVPLRVQAQGNSDCGFDLSQTSALMTQAQAKASSGDMTAALALLDQVTQTLDDIKARCGTVGPTTALTEQFKEAGGAYTIKYPKGWIAQPIPAGGAPDNDDTKPILFANDPAAFDVIADSKPNAKAQGVVVYIGSALQVVKQLGAFKSDKTYSQMSAEALLQAVVDGQTSSSAKLSAAEKVAPIGKFDAAAAAFTFSDSKTDTVVTKGTVLVLQLANDQFAVLVSFAAPGQEGTVAKLARNMADTLQVKSL